MVMQLIRPDAAPFPHKCLVCGNVQRLVVMFDSSQEWYGRLLICVDCLSDAAAKFTDVVPGNQYRELSRAWEESKQGRGRFEQAILQFNEGFANAVAGLNHYIDSATADADGTLNLLELSDDAEDSESEPAVVESDHGPESEDGDPLGLKRPVSLPGIERFDTFQPLTSV